MEAFTLNPASERGNGGIGVVLGDGRPEALRHYLFILGEHDPGLVSHVLAVAAYAREIAQQTGMSRRHTEFIWLAGLLHDVGKLAVPRSILRKRGPLTMTERKAIQAHSEAGWRMLAGLEWAEELAPLVRSHHEWWDGSGYPDGLAGNNIPAGARILAAADALDAMTSERVYRQTVGFPEAVHELCAMAGRQFDPEVVAVARAVPERTWRKLRREAIESATQPPFPIAG